MDTHINIPDPYGAKLGKLFHNNPVGMQDFIAKSLEHYFEYLEDYQLGLAAEAAEKEGFIGLEESAEFLHNIRNAKD
jgi:hypothetical protein